MVDIYNTYKRRARPLEENEELWRWHDDHEYFEKVEKILNAPPTVGVTPEISRISATVYLGSQANAENLELLKYHGITHLLNCGRGNSYTTNKLYRKRKTEKMYGNDNEFKHVELGAVDRESYDIRQHFERAHSFIEYADSMGGRTLIYSPGVSRSGAVALSYMVNRMRVPLLEATQILKDKRRLALCNIGFMKQCVHYAQACRMLDFFY